MKQVIQIIGGLYRGKKIQFPDIEGLRPTPNRVRETLFNWLMQPIKNARCLDAFAGSGALGLEAFSRGAAQVDFIEQSPVAHAQLHKILAQFNSPKLKLIKDDTLGYLNKPSAQFDLIFLDPPFEKNYIPPCLTAIIQNNFLAPDGLVYIESSHPVDIDEKIWETLKLKRAGQVHYGLIKKL